MFGDAARLQQVLWNLLSNAIKFTPESGRIEVRLRRSGAHTAVAVTDNGTGIRAEVLPHIFDRFHQADRSITRRFGGLGLGLSIVKHLVDLHGGSVQAESPGEGRGATFTITLPVTVARLATPAGAAVVTAAGGPVTQSLLDSLHVLLVEDEPDTRDFLRRLLEAHGAVVRGAGSADEALAAFSAARPDVLVSDIGLPDVDGYQLLARIRALDTPGARTVPAVALTAYARDEDRRRALGAGFQAHIAKPVEATELVAAIAGIAGSLPASRKLT